MKFFIVLSTLLVAACAAPSIVLTQQPTIYAGAPLLSQYHSQDSLGQYTYGYSGGPSAKNEVRSLDGVTRGSYSYVDPEGKLQTVAYSADALNGFRVAATNLPEGPKELNVAPEPVKDTPEVVKARAEHLAIVEQGGVAPLPTARLAVPELEPVKETEEVKMAREEHLRLIEEAKNREGPVVPQVELKPVEETPEVKMAREEHLKSVENAKLRNAAIEAVQDIRVLPGVIAAPGIVAPRIGLIGQPGIQLIKSDPIVTKIETPVITKIAATEQIAAIPSVRLTGTPIVQQTIVPQTPFFEVKSVANPYAYKWNIVAPDYSTNTIVNAGIPTGYTIVDNGRLIRSADKN